MDTIQCDFHANYFMKKEEQDPHQTPSGSATAVISEYIFLEIKFHFLCTYLHTKILIPAVRLTCIACFSPISQSILNQFL